MAIDLKAILRLDDRLSKQLKNVDRAISTTAKNSGRLSKAIGDVGKHGTSGMNSVTSAVGKVSLALGGAVSAAKLFQSTIGEAMKFEQSSVLIEAMFDDKKLSNQYNAMIQKMAQDSPIMNTSDMMGSSKAFIGITKDLPALKQAWKVAEKLSIMDPEQGLQGAVYAMKELASGDGVSMAERFEMPKSVVNDLKKLSFEDQLAGIQKYLDKAGITNKTVDKMGTTTMAKWNQVKERMSSVFRNMGTDGNSGIGKALDDVLAKINSPAFDKFAQTMNVKIGGAITKATEYAVKFASYVQNNWGTITSVAKGVAIAFVGLKSLSFLVRLFSTITTVVGAGVKVFRGLWKVVGFVRKAFTLVRLAMMLFPGSWIVVAIGAVIAAGILLYKNWNRVKTVWSSVWKSIKQNAADSVNSVIGKINALIGTINKIPGVNIPIIPKVNWGASEVAPAKKISKSNPQLGSMVNYAPKNYGGLNLTGHSHKGGLNRVPYDGYVARLHANEKILTAEQAKTYDSGNGGVLITGNTFNVRQESDIEAIASVLASKVYSAAGRGA
ncbi:hypothetical protein [Rummeliibacillus sp. SL167]|uniref:hypothetical protein n=1 Tax=Rummeliibacillus sp. SL167 TaxID=2579792 RepID=UPI0011B80947|nr:hypothetical protein [Rummeliibacillus sp. SL167]